MNASHTQLTDAGQVIAYVAGRDAAHVTEDTVADVLTYRDANSVAEYRWSTLTDYLNANLDEINAADDGQDRYDVIWSIWHKAGAQL